MRLEIRDLAKTYRGGRQALAGVSLTVDRGLFGLLGPNGAGKTTLMKIACTLLDPTAGEVLLDGKDVLADRDFVRRRLGYLGQEWGAPRSARCGEVVDLVLRLRGVHEARKRRAEVARLLGLVGLEAHAQRKLKTLSGGMVRRLGVAQALAGEPDLLVMDEPTVGLDPNERVEFRNLLSHLGRERTVVLSTHVVADVGNTCERVAILDGGRVRFAGTPAELTAKARGSVFEVVVPPGSAEPSWGEAILVTTIPSAKGTICRVVGRVPEGLPATAAEPTLEDAYLLLVGEAGAQEDQAAA